MWFLLSFQLTSIVTFGPCINFIIDVSTLNLFRNPVITFWIFVKNLAWWNLLKVPRLENTLNASQLILERSLHGLSKNRNEMFSDHLTSRSGNQFAKVVMAWIWLWLLSMKQSTEQKISLVTALILIAATFQLVKQNFKQNETRNNFWSQYKNSNLNASEKARLPNDVEIIAKTKKNWKSKSPRRADHLVY